jgi:hypothetical protein
VSQKNKQGTAMNDLTTTLDAGTMRETSEKQELARFKLEFGEEPHPKLASPAACDAYRLAWTAWKIRAALCSPIQSAEQGICASCNGSGFADATGLHNCFSCNGSGAAHPATDDAKEAK